MSTAALNTQVQYVKQRCVFHSVPKLLEKQALCSQICRTVSVTERIEEQLRLRERELTALKGALKEEVASRDQEVESVRQQYQRDAEQLRRSMQDATQACDKSAAGKGAALRSWYFFHGYNWNSP